MAVAPGAGEPSLMREGRETLRLALPLIVGQLSQMLMGLVDTLMIGRVGVTELAAAAFANTVLHLPLMLGIGMAVAVSIRVSQARGAKEPERARAALRHGLQVQVVLGALVLLAAWLSLPYLGRLRQSPEVIAVVPGYFLLVAASMTPAMAGMAVKHHADAMNRPWPVFWIMLGSVGLNVVLNWLLIFGPFGLPALGLEGAGWATLLARGAAFVGMIGWCLRAPGLREWVPYRWFRAPEWPAMRRLLGIGFPASLQLLAEVSAFVFATLMIGSLGEAALASHQIAISCAATVFMVPLGISMALTVRVGEAWGAGQPWRLRPILIGGGAIGVGFTLLSASAFLAFNETIAGWFIDEPEALRVAAALLWVAAAFQMSDTAQIVAGGALRGLDDVKIPAWIALGAYWGVSIPLGWCLAFPLGGGVQGIWWGITVGLTLTAVALGLRVWRRTHPERVPPFVPEG